MASHGFELGKCIAKGSQGNVCLARNKFTGEEAIGKVVCFESTKAADLFEVEARNTMFLQGHQNVVGCYDTLASDTMGVLLLEKMDMDLLTYILEANNGDGVGEIEASQIFRKVCRGLMWCHEQGIAHLDLKPENVLVNHDGAVRLADFGASVEMSVGETRTGRRGTLLYCAPEMRGAYCPFAADMWSLGVLLHVLVFGRWPFPGKESELEVKAKKGIIRLPIAGEECSHALADLLSILLTPVETRADLETVLAHEWLAPVPSLGLLEAIRCASVASEPSPLTSARVRRKQAAAPSDLADKIGDALRCLDAEDATDSSIFDLTPVTSPVCSFITFSPPTSCPASRHGTPRTAEPKPMLAATWQTTPTATTAPTPAKKGRKVRDIMSKASQLSRRTVQRMLGRLP